MTNNVKDTRKAAGKALDWATKRETSLRAVHSRIASRPTPPPEAKQKSYVATGSASETAREEERVAVLHAFCSNTVVSTLDWQTRCSPTG